MIRVEPGDCLEVMARLKAEGVTECPPNRALEIGKAAEHLVCADLILNGYRAYLSDQGLPYDVVVDLSGRLIRIQVKATIKLKPVPKRNHTPKYQWHVRRAGKGSARIIGNDEFDVLALVALDIHCIAYMPISDRIRQTIHLRPPGVANAIRRTKAKVNRCVDEYPFAKAIKEMAGWQ